MSSHHQLPPGYHYGQFQAQPYASYPAPQFAPYGYSPYSGQAPVDSYTAYGQIPGNVSFLGLGGQRFWTGALLGATAAFLLTNENVQRATIKTAVKAWSLMEGGFEELKERFRDAQAEIKAEEEHHQ
nr:hypothetical protein [Gammaproteobacteria bacterium]